MALTPPVCHSNAKLEDEVGSWGRTASQAEPFECDDGRRTTTQPASSANHTQRFNEPHQPSPPRTSNYVHYVDVPYPPTNPPTPHQGWGGEITGPSGSKVGGILPVTNNGCCGDNTFYNLAKNVPKPKAIHTAAKADGCMACVCVSVRGHSPHDRSTRSTRSYARVRAYAYVRERAVAE